MSGTASDTVEGLRVISGSEARACHVVQGEHRISGDPAVVLVTILGSCVAACLRDPIAGIGGMNHFLLPGDLAGHRAGAAEREAVHAMELLVNDLLVHGAARSRLEAKIFGGACTMSGLADVGTRNAEFAVHFLEREGIPIVGHCLGGQSGRRVQYWPSTGRARRSFIDYAKSPALAAPRPAPKPISPDAGMLELF